MTVSPTASGGSHARRVGRPCGANPNGGRAAGVMATSTTACRHRMPAAATTGGLSGSKSKLERLKPS